MGNSEKSFNDKWEEIWKNCKLPNTAKEQILISLSERTKELIVKSKKSSSDIARIIQAAVDSINNGSTEALDITVQKRL